MIEFCNHKWETKMEGGRIIHPSQPWMWYDEDSICIMKESALLIADEKPNEVHYWDGNVYKPTVACGLMRSVEKFEYGRFSAEIKLPEGRNLWPSFWLVGCDDSWPACGEIDIMEAWSNRLGYFRFGIPQPPYLVPCWKTTTNVHWEENEQHRYTGSRSLPIFRSWKRPAKNFIKYEVDWKPDEIVFYVDGKKIRSYGSNVSDMLLFSKMRVIFNVWTTGKDFECKTMMAVRNFEYKPL